MAGKKSAKVILLYFMKILLEETDENHPMPTDGIIKRLNDYGYSCERKSIYRHIETLREFNVEIMHNRNEPRGYYVIDRRFELHELKLLADAIQSSRFITPKKTEQLIEKLGSLASVYEAKDLRRDLHLLGTNKTDNERVFYTLDAVYGAIRSNRRVEFKYFRYMPDKSKSYRNNGATYVVSPYAVVWDDEKYYMHAYHEKYDTISSFRIDMMESVKISESARLKQDEYKNYNPNERAKTAFSQFGGEPITVLCEFDNSLAGAVFDHFGTDIVTSPVGKDRFRVGLRVAMSQKFLAWLFGFGDKVKVISPQSVIDSLCGSMDNILALYKD